MDTLEKKGPLNLFKLTQQLPASKKKLKGNLSIRIFCRRCKHNQTFFSEESWKIRNNPPPCPFPATLFISIQWFNIFLRTNISKAPPSKSFTCGCTCTLINLRRADSWSKQNGKTKNFANISKKCKKRRRNKNKVISNSCGILQCIST